MYYATCLYMNIIIAYQIDFHDNNIVREIAYKII